MAEDRPEGDRVRAALGESITRAYVTVADLPENEYPQLPEDEIEWLAGWLVDQGWSRADLHQQPSEVSIPLPSGSAGSPGWLRSMAGHLREGPPPSLMREATPQEHADAAARVLESVADAIAAQRALRLRAREARPAKLLAELSALDEDG